MPYNVQLPPVSQPEQFPGASPIPEKPVTTGYTGNDPQSKEGPRITAYRHALWHLWTLPPGTPRTVYDQAHEEVFLPEAALSPSEAQTVLREEARRFHQETGCCPFCQEEGELHLDG